MNIFISLYNLNNNNLDCPDLFNKNKFKVGTFI